jgi:hypothetical protein
LTNSLPSAPALDDNQYHLLNSTPPYSQVFQVQQQQPYHQQQPSQRYYTEFSTYLPPYVPTQPQPNLPTHPTLINRVVQVPLKLIGALCFGGLTVLFGGSAFIAGTTTSILFAVGNPSCLLTGIVTLGFAAGAGKCAQVALKVLFEAGRDFNALMS